MIVVMREFSVLQAEDDEVYTVLLIREKDGEVSYFCSTEAGNPEWIPDDKVSKVIVDDE